MVTVAYKEVIENIVQTLKSGYKPEKIILFGSCASGKVTPNSDIDMLIIKNTKKKYGQRWMDVTRLVRHIERQLPFEPFVITQDEFKSQIGRNFFLQEIMKKGKVLYEKN